MVFSQAKWAVGDGPQIVHASRALSWETVSASFLQAWNLFVVPLLGEGLCGVLTSVFEKEEYERSDDERLLLHHAQMAVANLALWHNFTELNVRLTDQGHQRQETENFKSVFKYQEGELKRSYKNKGFNALDSLLTFFDAHADGYPDWVSAPARVERSQRVVRSAAEVDGVVFINRSYIIFLRLQPILKKLEQTYLPVLLGRRLCEALLEHLDDTSVPMGGTTVEELRVRVGRVLVNRAVADLIRQTGSLTDRGLYFDMVSPGRMGDETHVPTGSYEGVQHAQVFERDALEQERALHNFVELHIPELCACRPEDVFRRDNDGKRTVWL